VIINDSSAENLTGLKQSTDIVLVTLFLKFLRIKKINLFFCNLGSRTFSLTVYKIVFHYFLGN
jgi:hypothetical protein